MFNHSFFSIHSFFLPVLGLLLAGALLGCHAATPSPAAATPSPVLSVGDTPLPLSPTPVPTFTSTPEPLPSPSPTPLPLTISLDPALPATWQEALQQTLAAHPLLPDGRRGQWATSADNAIRLAPLAEVDQPLLAQRFFALVAPFATVRDDVSWPEVQAMWRGEGEQTVWVTEENASLLRPVLGEVAPGNITDTLPTADRLAETQSLAILPFDELDPTYKVLTIDGLNVLDNHLMLRSYPLAVAVWILGPDAPALATLFDGAIPPATNRDPEHLTQLIMTGVTAMSRGTAEKMEQKGYTYPALVISDTLRAADITHVSNEVPFIKGCKVNNTYMNLVLCSDYPYWQALEAIGTDIVGLSGNHVNDFGRKGARESLKFYRDRNIPIYGSGFNEEEACAPLMWEDHGNTFAFLAALAWWPETAWATADQPGACYFYNNYEAILAKIRELSQQVDIVAVELQYAETYHPWPTRDQVQDFRALRAAGADIVTGVQSHVPQAMEPYGRSETGGPGIIVYGLGNLFFDQMQDWDTRTALIARHTIYNGRLLSTEILTTVLEDFAQPRWATPEERAGILRSIFKAAPEKGVVPPAEPTATPVPDNGGASPAPTPATTPVSGEKPAPTPRPQPDLPWPTPVPEPSDHYWLARPTHADVNQIASSAYPFGGTENGRYRVHHGADIANPSGTTLYAPASALVVYAGLDQPPHILGAYPDFFGNVVLLQLDRNWQDRPVYVLYGHMQEVLVSTGQHVDANQPVGRVGMTGIAIGPHVHVEVRLDNVDYEHSYNPNLWLAPLPGLGTVAGQVVTPDGRAWPEVNVLLYQVTDEGRRLYRVIPTYASDPGIHPDPLWAENFVLGDVPAGNYELVLRLRQQILTQPLTVNAGSTNYARFVVAP